LKARPYKLPKANKQTERRTK